MAKQKWIIERLTIEEMRELWQPSFDLCDKTIAENEAKKREANKAYIEAYQKQLREDFTIHKLHSLIATLQIEYALEVLIFNCNYPKSEMKRFKAINCNTNEFFDFILELAKKIKTIFP